MRYFDRSDGRRYTIGDPERDLLGDWFVPTTRGSSNSRRGGVTCYVAGSQADAEQRIARLVQRRLQHGYLERPWVTV